MAYRLMPRLEFIFEKSLFPELEYIFKHALTRDVAYNSLLQKRRREIHEQIGKAIEELYPNRLEELYEMLAYHYSKSTNLEKAYHYLKLSGQKAWGNFSHIEAYKYFKQAINFLDQFPDSDNKIPEMIHARMLISGPMLAMVFPDDSLAILKEGERLSEKIVDIKSLANFHFNISKYYNFNQIS